MQYRMVLFIKSCHFWCDFVLIFPPWSGLQLEAIVSDGSNVSRHNQRYLGRSTPGIRPGPRRCSQCNRWKTFHNRRERSRVRSLCSKQSSCNRQCWHIGRGILRRCKIQIFAHRKLTIPSVKTYLATTWLSRVRLRMHFPFSVQPGFKAEEVANSAKTANFCAENIIIIAWSAGVRCNVDYSCALNQGRGSCINTKSVVTQAFAYFNNILLLTR